MGSQGETEVATRSTQVDEAVQYADGSDAAAVLRLQRLLVAVAAFCCMLRDAC